MAGHSQFKNIMYRKGAQDKKRAKAFAKLIREITVAAKSGMPEPRNSRHIGRLFRGLCVAVWFRNMGVLCHNMQ